MQVYGLDKASFYYIVGSQDLFSLLLLNLEPIEKQRPSLVLAAALAEWDTFESPQPHTLRFSLLLLYYTLVRVSICILYYFYLISLSLDHCLFLLFFV